MNGKKPKFGKLLRNNPGVYLAIFIFILFEAFAGLLAVTVLIPSVSQTDEPAPILPAILTFGILFAIGGRGVFKYAQYKKSDAYNEYKKKKRAEAERARLIADGALQFNSPSAAAPKVSPVQSTQTRPNIMERYLKALAYLTGCGTFDEAKFREMNRLAGG